MGIEIQRPLKISCDTKFKIQILEFFSDTNMFLFVRTIDV